jgi:SAM-dependent methyltransferase
VGKARKIIEQDLGTQLLKLGIKPNNGAIRSRSAIDPQQAKKRAAIEDVLRKERSAVDSDEAAIQRYIRQAGFTFVNRIAALRALEVRGFIIETVVQRSKFGGFSLRGRNIAEKDPKLNPQQVLETSLTEAFDEISQEIGALFELDREYSLLFPTTRTIKDLISLLTEQVTEEDWLQDDIIGWIYQYYNDEIRAQFKKSKKALNADDVPILNQFYTPHWIVRLLTDNTLGRLWLERQDRCSYLASAGERRQFFDLRQIEPGTGSDDDSSLSAFEREYQNVDTFCSYFLPLPQKPQPRGKEKRARDIRILDPACGSGHFLIYAFDVLYRIYLEDEPELSKDAIPQLILENNLFGVDVDLRAVQLAALNLYLKAKSYNSDLRISKMNLVCADSHIANSKNREKFLERFLSDPALQKIFKTLFEKLNHTNELGSLLKVREPFEALLESRRTKHTQAHFAQNNIPSVQANSSALESAKPAIGGTAAQQMMIIPKKTTFEEMLNELETFERECLERQDIGSLIFAAEAEKSTGLLSLLSQKYDVILMNPPYGGMPKKCKEYAKKNYPKTHHDYSAAFIEQAVNLIEPGGYVGGLVSRSFMFLKSYQWLRETLLAEETTLNSVFDLGSGVLEGATARWAALVTHKLDRRERSLERASETAFLRFVEANSEEQRIELFGKALDSITDSRSSDIVHYASSQELSKVPGMPYSYWTTPSIREIFARFPPLDKDGAGAERQVKVADVKEGMHTNQDQRFIRQYWEVPTESLGKVKWVPFLETGAGTSFYSDILLVVNWADNGRELKALKTPIIPNQKYYFAEGIYYPLIVSSRRLGFRRMPPGVIFGHAVGAIFPSKNEYVLPLLALGNSTLFAYLFRILDDLSHNRTAGYMSKLPVNLAALRSRTLTAAALEAYYLTKEDHTGLEISPLFVKPRLLQMAQAESSGTGLLLEESFMNELSYLDWSHIHEIHNISGSFDMSLRELALRAIRRKKLLDNRLKEIQETIDTEVFKLYTISEEDRKIIERELFGDAGEDNGRNKIGNAKYPAARQTEAVEIERAIKSETAALVSYYIKLAMSEDQDGVIPLNDSSEEDSLAKRVIVAMGKDFGADRLKSILEEIHEFLGAALEDWILNDYFDYHVDQYKRRPIHWQLTSKGFADSRDEEIAFSCFVNYYKLTRDTIPKIIAHYLTPVKRSVHTRHENLENEVYQAKLSNDRSQLSQKAKDLQDSQNLLNQLEAFEEALINVTKPQMSSSKSSISSWFQEKVKETSENGWNPVLDYGVLVNIQPLMQANLLQKGVAKVK